LGAARARRVPRRFSETRQRGARAGGEGGVRAICHYYFNYVQLLKY
jgi:hypothetical protein